MRILTLTILASFIGFMGLQAQENEQPTFAKHSVGICFANGTSSIFTKDKPDRNAGLMSAWYKPQYATALGVLYQYRPLRWFSVETGVEYNTSKWKYDMIHSDPWSAWDGEGYNQALASITDYGQRMHRWAAPVNFRWYYTHHKTSVYALTGLVLTFNWVEFFDYEINEWDYTEDQIMANKLKQNFSLAASTGVGVEYQATPCLLLRFEGQFRVYDLLKSSRRYTYAYSSTSHEYDINYIYPWSLVANVGIYYTPHRKS